MVREAELKREHIQRCKEIALVRDIRLKQIEEARKAKAVERVAAIKKSPTTAKHHMLQRFAARQLDCKLDEVIFQSLPSAGGLACLPRQPTVGEAWRGVVSPGKQAHHGMSDLENLQARFGRKADSPAQLA